MPIRAAVCPDKVFRQLPKMASQILTNPSSEPEMKPDPLGCHCTDPTCEPDVDGSGRDVGHGKPGTQGHQSQRREHGHVGSKELQGAGGLRKKDQKVTWT